MNPTFGLYSELVDLLSFGGGGGGGGGGGELCKWELALKCICTQEQNSLKKPPKNNFINERTQNTDGMDLTKTIHP